MLGLNLVHGRDCFKPYYKWITFNTLVGLSSLGILHMYVLNLIINGLPSIPKNLKISRRNLC